MGRSRRSKLACLLLAGLALSLAGRVSAQTPGPRLALVIGEGQYRGGSLPTALNDAGLVAQTLQTIGFDVTGAANLDARGMRQAFSDFLAKVQSAGQDAIVFVYVSGEGVQYAGENYLVPIEATIARDNAVPQEAVRVAELTGPLGALTAKARIVVLDAAHRNALASTGTPLAGGLVLTDPTAGSLSAFNAAPGTIAPDEQGPYGIYAQSLSEMLRQGGATLDDVFAQTRLRVNEETRGALLPWDESQIDQPIVLLPRAPGVPVVTVRGDYRTRPVRSLSPSEAYATVIERDTLAGYEDFLTAFPRDPLAARVRVIVAARREALTWQRTLRANRPNAYWTYMLRYPRGPHVADARRRLAILTAALEPPPRFDVYEYDDLPPPPPDEYVYVDRRYLIFDEFDYPPPPPPPIGFLPPDRDFRREPPPPATQPGFLPIPIPIPIPGLGSFGGRPGTIAQPNFGQQGPGGLAPSRPPPSAPATPAPLAPQPTPAPQTLPQPGRPGGPPAPGITPALPQPGQSGQPTQSPAVTPQTPVAPQALPRPGQDGLPPAPGTPPLGQPSRPVEPGPAPAVPRTPAAVPQALPRPGQTGTPAAAPIAPATRMTPTAPRPEKTRPAAPIRPEPKAEPRIAPRVEPRAPEPKAAPVAPRAPVPRAAPPAAVRPPPAAPRPAAPPPAARPAPPAARPPPPAGHPPASRPPGTRPEREGEPR